MGYIHSNVSRVPPNPTSTIQKHGIKKSKASQLNAHIDEQATGHTTGLEQAGSQLVLICQDPQKCRLDFASETSSQHQLSSKSAWEGYANSFGNHTIIQRSQNSIWWPQHISSPAGICDCYRCCNSKVDPSSAHLCMSAKPNSKRGKRKMKSAKIIKHTIPRNLRSFELNRFPLFFREEGENQILKLCC